MSIEASLPTGSSHEKVEEWVTTAFDPEFAILTNNPKTLEVELLLEGYANRFLVPASFIIQFQFNIQGKLQSFKISTCKYSL